MKNLYWKHNNYKILSTCTHLINEATEMADEKIASKCDKIFRAINRFSDDYYSDSVNNIGCRRRFIGFFENVLPIEEKEIILNSQHVANLYYLNPLIMDEEVLGSLRYDPLKIPYEMRKEASKKHYYFNKNFANWKKGEENSNKVFSELCSLLYTVRCNLAHSDKTLFGPDLDKAKRDKAICEIVLPILNVIIDIYFEKPYNRLAIYGYLSNSELLGNEYDKQEGYVEGSFIEDEHYKYYVSVANGKRLKVDLITSENSFDYDRIDRFEGEMYKRILAPVYTSKNDIKICYIYAKV